jgi:hypothetical protein
VTHFVNIGPSVSHHAAIRRAGAGQAVDEDARSAHDEQPTRLRVLWATDDSDAARTAEEWLLRLRWSTPPVIDVLTVAPRQWRALGLAAQTYRPAVHDAVAGLRQEELMSAMRIANAAGQRLQRGGLAVQIWARHGAPPDEIVAVVRSERPDLVVISPGGRRSRLLPGPTASDAGIIFWFASLLAATVMLLRREVLRHGPEVQGDRLLRRRHRRQ